MENQMNFYYVKWRLFLGVIFSLLFVALGVFLLLLTPYSLVIIILALFITVLFSFFFAGNLLKLLRGHPYIIITDEYMLLDPYTKSEVTIYFTDISRIEVSQASFQNIIEIVLRDEDDYFAGLSFHNKVRLFMNRKFQFSLFTIRSSFVRKKERSTLLKALDIIIRKKFNPEEVDSVTETVKKEDKEIPVKKEKDFMTKYDPAPPVDRTFDRSYFLRAYGYSLYLFILFFVLVYLLITRDNFYLFYIFISFIFYPFANVLMDWLFRFKLRHALDKQKGIPIYFEQLLYFFDFIVFHVSLFVAPIGILFLLIRFIVIRIKD